MSDLIARQSKLKFKQHQDALDWSEEAVTHIVKLEAALTQIKNLTENQCTLELWHGIAREVLE